MNHPLTRCISCVHSYKEGGPAALANFESGVQGFTKRSFRGCGVVTSDPFEVSDDTEAVQMLQRFSQVGEHYFMSLTEGSFDGAGKMLPGAASRSKTTV